MVKKVEPTFKEKFIERLEKIFRSKIIFLWIILGIGFVSIMIFFIWDQREKSIKNTSAQIVENVSEIFLDWELEEDQDEKIKKENEIIEILNGVLKKYPKYFAAQQALKIKAELNYKKGNIEDSLIIYLDIVSTFPDSLFAPVALKNAAICQEELNKIDDAIESYSQLIEDYNTQSNKYIIPYCLFSLGRIYEQKESFEDALQFYLTLEEEYSQSNWTILAQNRIIYLKANKKVSIEEET